MNSVCPEDVAVLTPGARECGLRKKWDLRRRSSSDEVHRVALRPKATRVLMKGGNSDTDTFRGERPREDKAGVEAVHPVVDSQPPERGADEVHCSSRPLCGFGTAA